MGTKRAGGASPAGAEAVRGPSPWSGDVRGPAPSPAWLGVQLGAALLATLAFTVTLRARSRDALVMGAAACLTVGADEVGASCSEARPQSSSQPSSSVSPGGLVGTFLRRSALVFVVPGVVMLVPGSAGFKRVLQRSRANQTVSGITRSLRHLRDGGVDRLRPHGRDRPPAGRPTAEGIASRPSELGVYERGFSMIVPRWEWRTFGERFGAAEDRLAELTPTRVDDSDELYIVSSRGEGSIKVRGGLLDVKRLEQVSDEGLEQWRPVAKAEFPIAATDVAELLSGLDVAVPALDRDAYDLDELVDEVVRPSADLLSVSVHKRRVRYALGGCMAELTEVQADSLATRTIAVEAEDPALVRTAVEELGLWSRPNVSFPRGLKALVGFGARRYGVVDVGTNSVKFHLAERSADGAWRQLVDRAEVTRLGEGLEESGRLQPEPMARTIDAIAAMADEAGRHGAEAIAAVGTAGLRAAGNSAAFVEAVQARCGVRVEVISGEEEARLAFLAATSGIERVDGSLVVFETGGGSTQFTFGQEERVEEQFSVPVGAVRIAEQFGLDGVVDDTVLATALDAIAADLASLDGRPTPATLVAMGGAVTNLASVKHELVTYDPEIVQGSELDLEELDRLIELFRSRSAEERRKIVGLQPKRAEIILAGACIVRTVLEKLGRESLTVSDRGLRHRLLVERFGS